MNRPTESTDLTDFSSISASACRVEYALEGELLIWLCKCFFGAHTGSRRFDPHLAPRACCALTADKLGQYSASMHTCSLTPQCAYAIGTMLPAHFSSFAWKFRLRALIMWDPACWLQPRDDRESSFQRLLLRFHNMFWMAALNPNMHSVESLATNVTFDLNFADYMAE